MKEIGSEFSKEKTELNSVQNMHIEFNGLVFSGRTALETVLKNEPTIKKAMLPSYCCDSMIEPFRRAGIEVYFYPVFYEDGLRMDLDIPGDVDCLLWCNYFGFRNEMPDLSCFIERGGIIIEDITHSLYSNKPSHRQSHYLVASVRKWEPVLCGGYCASRTGPLTVFPDETPPSEFLKTKRTAMQMKARYLQGDTAIDKDTYLRLFSHSNHWLAEHYAGLTIDAYSENYFRNVDWKAHANARRKNALLLYEALENCADIRFLFESSRMDCPLFVPVLIESTKRDAVRQILIENQIYCPVHWPKPDSNCESNIYDIELSLICDQRYNDEDMLRIASVLKKL